MFILVKRDDDTASYSFIPPDDVDISTISAKNKNGLLIIKINNLSTIIHLNYVKQDTYVGGKRKKTQ